MNLKLVVASMSVLGLVSCPVFAATHHKHKHHHTMKHHHRTEMATAGMASHVDYKGMLEPACVIPQSSIIMDQMNQAIGSAMPSPCNPGWFNRIQVSGGVNFDFGKFGNRNMAYMGENYQRFSLNPVYFNVLATVNDWVKAFASIVYSNPTTVADGNSLYAGEYSATYANNIGSMTAANNLALDQGYIRIMNSDISPFFLQLGKYYQDFSRYELHPITRSLTQSMSEIDTTAAKLGFITQMGFNGSLYVFDNPIAKVGKTSKSTNYGLGLGYSAPGDQFGWDIGAAYLYNLIGVDDVAYNVWTFNSNAGMPGYHSRTGGTALYGDVNSGPFTFNARYTAAYQRFNALDLPKHGVADLIAGTTTVAGTASGAKPWAAGAQAGYGFEGWGKNQNVYLGYQASRDAAGLNLPKSRWLVGYGIDMWKSTSWGIEWDHDMDYTVANGGSGRNTNLVSLRAAVQFG